MGCSRVMVTGCTLLRGDGKHQPATKHAAQATAQRIVDSDSLVGSLINAHSERDNGNVHRAAAKIIVSKSRAARGSVCNVLLSGGYRAEVIFLQSLNLLGCVPSWASVSADDPLRVHGTQPYTAGLRTSQAGRRSSPACRPSELSCVPKNSSWTKRLSLIHISEPTRPY